MAGAIKEEVRSLKRDKILEVASRLFFDRGYHGTSIESICNELGVTKPFIYYHFTRKDDILQALYQSSIDAALVIAEASRAMPTPLAQLTAFAREYALFVTSEYQPSIALHSREKGLLNREMMRDVNATKLRFLNTITAIIADGSNDGSFAVSEPQFAAQGILGMLNWIINWYRPEGLLSRDTLADRMVNMVLRSVGASPADQ